MIIVELPWVVSANNYYRICGRKLVISPRGRVMRKEIMATIFDKFGGFPEPLKGPVSVILRAYPPCKRIRDLDNLFKGLFDALTYSKIWVDDSQVKHIDATMCEIVKFGKVIVEINAL